MDARHFDDLLRSLFDSLSRRGIGRALAGLALGGTLGRLSLIEAEAKNKRKKKKKCKGGKKKCGKQCRELLTDPLNCGSCGNHCDDDMECLDGSCSCPVDETACGDTCCASGQNCVNGQCDDDPCPPEFICPPAQSCVNGECVCPDGRTVCEEACCEAGLTCVDGACEALCTPEIVCPIGQACVDGYCTCPSEACLAANDPTDDQFEGCFCAATVEGEQVCFANIACNSNPPTCTTSAECGAGFACFEASCGGFDKCIPLCDVS
jgi:hypothetical protein